VVDHGSEPVVPIAFARTAFTGSIFLPATIAEYLYAPVNMLANGLNAT
jgi:hypothetical protein